MNKGASLRETGSRASTEPPSSGSLGPTGFDPARVAARLSPAEREHLIAFPNRRRGNGGAAKGLHARGLLEHWYPSPFVNKPRLTAAGQAVRTLLVEAGDEG